MRALENDELRRDSLFSSLKRGMVGRGVGMSDCFLEKNTLDIDFVFGYHVAVEIVENCI